ncbi:MAG: protein kinase [Polyangiaceae bacterium]|nr:protein kinase [Polyangiaceae bacterium]
MFPTEPVPERIGAYKIVRRLSGTGSTKVYVGRKEGPMGFARQYTLKLVPNTAEGDTRFAEELAREAAICSTLNHQAIQRMIDFFEHDKNLVLVLEHIDGPTLERLLSYLEQSKRPLSDGAKAYVGREIASALMHAHAARDEDGKPMPIVHRGLHPEHVLVGWDGQVRLSGFGMGKILGRSPDTVVAMQKAGPGFKAPEQLRGEAVTPKADVYGLGLFIWSLFTGQKPSEKGIRPARLATMRPDLPKLVSLAIDAALETAVDKRPATCRDIEKALGQMAGIDKGRDELCEKVELLRDLRTNPDSGARPSIPAASRPRISLQGIRPAEPAVSSKERLSTIPPAPPAGIRPTASLPPILFDDVQPKSVYPLLRALAEKVPKSEGGIPRAPRVPHVEPVPSSVKSERVPRSGVPKLAIAAPLELDPESRVPRTEWMASVPDEEDFDKLFDDVTSRSPSELEAAGIGRNAGEENADAPQRSRRRMQFADTIPADADAPSTLASPPIGPPPDPNAKPVRFGPRPEPPAPPKLKRGFAPPPLPPARRKRPPVVALAVVFGLVAIGAALAVMSLSDKPDVGPAKQASASASASAAPPVAKIAMTAPAASTPSAAPTVTSAAPVEPPPPPLPYGQGYITVMYSGDATVYLSGRKVGQTNTRLQNKCGRYFVRVAKTASGAYPEWLSAGESVAIPCQDSIRITISR